MTTTKRWNAEEEKKLVELLQKKTPLEEIAKIHERSEGAVSIRSKMVAVKMLKNKSIEDVAKELHISKEDIENQIDIEDVKKKKKEASASDQSQFSPEAALKLLDKIRLELLKAKSP